MSWRKNIRLPALYAQLLRRLSDFSRDRLHNRPIISLDEVKGLPSILVLIQNPILNNSWAAILPEFDGLSFCEAKLLRCVTHSFHSWVPIPLVRGRSSGGPCYASDGS